LESERLRIAFVVHDYHRYGGHSRYVAELARRFRNNHEVHVFANRVDDADREGITFHHVPAWRRNALTTIASFVLPATLMVRGKFDVIHAQGLCGLRQNVITAHICQPAWFEAARRFGGRPPWRKRAFEAVVSRLDRLAMKPAAARAFIAPSERVKHDLAAAFRLNGQVRVIPHGTDIELFHPRNKETWRTSIRWQYGFAHDQIVALYVGDLQKAMPAMLKALSKTVDVTIAAVTRSDVAPFAALAAREGIADRIRFLPPTVHVERYYSAADFFLFPTYYDAFGMVVTEAMASELPVITNRAAGAAQFIEDRVSGWLTQAPWDPEQLAEAIMALAGDEALRSRMGKAARQAIENYTWDRTAMETMDVYRAVVKARCA
jgi:UDP-glucose:(heptosyl)LPS alpha-1,3-glucosyltransferase